MLPIVLISYRHGVKWGLFSGFCYSFLQMALGAKTVTAAFQPGYFGEGTMLFNAFLMCALDYVAAYTCLGLGGIFRSKLENRGLSLALGGLVALFARYLCHVLSGYILFSGYAEWFFTQDGFPAWGAALVDALSPQMLGFTYSAVYNGMYMLPEMAITAIGAILISKVPVVARKVS
jgi:thiamine transporter